MDYGSTQEYLGLKKILQFVKHNGTSSLSRIPPLLSPPLFPSSSSGPSPACLPHPGARGCRSPRAPPYLAHYLFDLLACLLLLVSTRLAADLATAAAAAASTSILRDPISRADARGVERSRRAMVVHAGGGGWGGGGGGGRTEKSGLRDARYGRELGRRATWRALRAQTFYGDLHGQEDGCTTGCSDV